MSSGGTSRGKQMTCKVLLLDDTMPTFQVLHKAHGCDLFEAVVKHLRLLEADYFGLEFKDSTGSLRWLDHEKYIVKQTGSHHDMTFRFSVKFYTPDPGLLEEEFTRYLFALQVKRDLASGSMPCNINTAALLSAYIAQAEIGDFNYEEFIDYTYLSSIRFVPNQSDEMEEKIMEHHKNLIGHTPADADFLLLDTARKVETYGIVLHTARDHEGVPLYLSTAHMGVLVFQNNTKINTFSWAKVRKLSFKRKRFLIKLHPEGYDYYKDTVDFFFETRDDCKAFWKKCIEHHAFFRCASIKRTPRNKTRVLSRGSSFRYSGRTQKQLTDHVRDNFVRRPGFERTTSVRVSTRSIGAKSNKSATLNSQGTNLSQQMSNSMSSGSHIINDPGADVPQSSSRIETVEVHSDSSHSGSVIITPPHPVADNNQSDGRVQLERTVADIHTKTEQSVDHLVIENKVAHNQSANQNANDNDKPPQQSSSMRVDPDNSESFAVLHIDEDELMNRKNETLNNNKINDEGNMSEMVKGEGTVAIVNDKSHDELDSKCTHKSPKNNEEDIQYVLHRRPIEPSSGNIAKVVLGNESHLTTSRPPVEFSTFRTPSPQPGSSPTSPMPSTADRQRDTNSSLSSPGISPMQTSPKSPRQRFDFVRVNKLPPRDSYSSADDSISPSFETEILAQFQMKIEQKSIVEKIVNKPEIVEDKSAVNEEKPLTFSTFRPPPIITTQGPTPTTPLSPVTSDFSSNTRGDVSTDSSSSESDSEDESEHEETEFKVSDHSQVFANPYMFDMTEKTKTKGAEQAIFDQACISSSTPIKTVVHDASASQLQFSNIDQEQSTVTSSRVGQQLFSGGNDPRPKSSIEEFFHLDGSSPIPFADDSPIPFPVDKDDDEDLPTPPPEAYENKSEGTISEVSPSRKTPSSSEFRPVAVATDLSHQDLENEVFRSNSSCSSDETKPNEESRDQLESLEKMNTSERIHDSSSESSESEDGSDDEDQQPSSALTGFGAGVQPDANGFEQGFFSNPYAESHLTYETKQTSRRQQTAGKQEYTFSSFGH